METLPPYPGYQEVGLPWLDKIPAHWKIQRGKTIFDCIDIRSATGQEELLTVSAERGIVPRNLANVTMFKAESYAGYKLCWPGDLIINSLWAWARGLGVSQHHGIISSAYGVYRLKPKFHGYEKYIHELVRSSPVQWELQVRSKGIWISRLQLTDTAFLEIPFPLPPPEEQTAIARYLDWADSRIRRLIRARQKQIKLLEEHKQVIIQQAVTGQIDVRTGQPYPAYKDSGVEWLGQVPEHWGVIKAQYFAKVGNGSTPSRGRSDYWQGGSFPWLNSSVANQTKVTSSDQFVTPVALRECHLPLLNPGTILVAITGQGKTRGKSTILDINATINQHLAYISIRQSNVLPEFLQLFLTAAYSHLRSVSDDAGSTKGALTCADLKRFKVLVPTIEEQRLILQSIDFAFTKINRIVEDTLRAIDLLKEYRTRLIADVVTGKVDVRQAAAALPKIEPEEELPEEWEEEAEGDAAEEMPEEGQDAE